jgi:hypothetical protein
MAALTEFFRIGFWCDGSGDDRNWDELAKRAAAFETQGTYSRRALASCRSGVSNPSVNQL